MGTASSRLGSYDSFSLALNPVTGTFLMVGADRKADTVLGLELNVRGFPFNGENTLSGTRPVYYPRVSTSMNSKNWNVVFSGGFANLSSLVATSFASAGGVGGAHPAPGAPPPAPAPITNPDSGWMPRDRSCRRLGVR